jgi:ADP-heptose:LPS heptosyltransferase
MNLENAIPLFQMKDINWVVISKDVSKNELQILKKYKVSYYGNVLDNGSNCFEDSVSIIRNVDGVVSTDTSLVHLSANLNIKTFILLTLGCEWRWTSDDKTTNWYSDSILIRQNKFNDWSNVIEELKNKL